MTPRQSPAGLLRSDQRTTTCTELRTAICSPTISDFKARDSVVVPCSHSDRCDKLAVMRRTIIKALIGFMLLTNLSWAVGMESSAAVEDAVRLGVCFVDVSPDAGGADCDTIKTSPCDHSCHASAHLLGLTAVPYIVFTDGTGKAPAMLAAVRYSRDAEPPLPPPNI